MRFIVLIVEQRLYLEERTWRKEETVLGSGTQLTPTDHTMALQPHPDETRRAGEKREKRSQEKIGGFAQRL